MNTLEKLSEELLDVVMNGKKCISKTAAFVIPTKRGEDNGPERIR